MDTHSLPVDHAELGASLLAALQVYGRPMTEEQGTKGYTPWAAMGYRSHRMWRRGRGSVGVEWIVDDHGTAKFHITPERAQGRNLFPVPESKVILDNSVTPFEIAEQVMRLLVFSQHLNGGPRPPSKVPARKKRARTQAQRGSTAAANVSATPRS